MGIDEGQYRTTKPPQLGILDVAALRHLRSIVLRREGRRAHEARQGHRLKHFALRQLKDRDSKGQLHPPPEPTSPDQIALAALLHRTTQNQIGSGGP